LGQTYNHPWAAAVPLRLIHHIQDWVTLDRTPNQSMVGRINSPQKTRVQKFENTPFSFGDVTNGDVKGCNEHPGSFRIETYADVKYIGSVIRERAIRERNIHGCTERT
jgi:hypothetical protein